MNYIALLIILLAICILSIVGFDYYKNITFRRQLFFLFHRDYLQTYLVMNREFEEKYPNLFKLIASFRGVDISKVIANPKSLSKVSEEQYSIVKTEMVVIVNSGTEIDKQILSWYFITCDYISDSLEKDKLRLSREDKFTQEALSDKPSLGLADVEGFHDGLCCA